MRVGGFNSTLSRLVSFREEINYIVEFSQVDPYIGHLPVTSRFVCLVLMYMYLISQ